MIDTSARRTRFEVEVRKSRFIECERVDSPRRRSPSRRGVDRTHAQLLGLPDRTAYRFSDDGEPAYRLETHTRSIDGRDSTVVAVGDSCTAASSSRGRLVIPTRSAAECLRQAPRDH